MVLSRAVLYCFCGMIFSISLFSTPKSRYSGPLSIMCSIFTLWEDFKSTAGPQPRDSAKNMSKCPPRFARMQKAQRLINSNCRLLKSPAELLPQDGDI